MPFLKMGILPLFRHGDIVMIYDGVDYTAEIRVRNGKYFLRQLQSKVDRGAPDEAMKFVRQLIAKVTPKRS